MDVIYRLGDFELDPARFELRCGDTCVDVQPKVLRLLLHLVEQRERAVSSEELMRVLWPEAKVGSGSIKRAVLGARQALGERGEEQTRIRTVRGFGYRFIGDVQVGALAGANETPRPADALLRSTRPHVRDALLGRERVMDLLQESLQQVLSGMCRCVLLTGGPGLGKSRTIEELLADAQQLGADAWIGRCTEVEGAPAFWPFIQVMSAALRLRGPTELRALLGTEGADLAGVFTELREQWPDLHESAPLASTSVRFRLYDSMAVFMRRAAERRPIVLALDDLHRADPGSLRLLAFLAPQLQHARILILGALRPEVPDSPETARLLEALKSASRCITLHGLEERDIARYLQLATGAEPPTQVIERLHAQTAGNPLFLQHLVESWRARVERSLPPAWQTLTGAPPSAGLTGAIERHLELVPGPCRELLRVAAVLGTEFSAGILTRIAEQDAAESNAHLAEASASGLIRSVANELGRFRFAHVLVRDALYLQLPATTRSALHVRAACALEAQGIGDNAILLTEVTRHFVHAAPADPERALRYTLRAAEQALRTHAYEQAAEHFDGALELLQYQAPDPRLRMSLLLRKGDALARVDMPAARAPLFDAAALARELGDAEPLARAAVAIASRPDAGFVDGTRVDILRQALAMLAAQDDCSERQALLQALLAKSLLYSTDPERALLARSALKRAQTLADAAQRAEVLTRCHEALAAPEHIDERLEVERELMRLAVATGDTLSLLQAYAAHVETCVERGDMNGVDSAISSIDVLAERVREPYFRWFSRVIRAMRAYVRGDIPDSDRLLNEAWQSSASVSAELARNIYRVQWLAILRMRGQNREAAPMVQEMALSCPAVPGWSAAWGALLWDLGRYDEARACLAHLMDRGAASLLSDASGLANGAALCELCCKVGDETAARSLYQVLFPYAQYHGYTTFGASTYGPLQRHLATLAECYGDVPLADSHYRAALTAAERMCSPVYASGTSCLYARMLLRAGDPRRSARAAELLVSALRQSEQFGLHSLALVARRLATRHGVSVAPRTSSRG